MTILTKAVPADLWSPAFAPSRSTESADDWLPKIAASDVAPLNALHRHRRPIEAVVAGHTITIETIARAVLAANAHAFRLTLSGRPALLRLSTSVVDLCVQSLGVRDSYRLNGVRAGMLLELALLHTIKALEARLGTEIHIEEGVAAIEWNEQPLPLHLLIRGLPTGEAGMELLLDRHSSTLVAQALDELTTPNAVAAALPIPIRICRDGVELTLAQLRTLRPGDILMPARDLARPRGLIAVVGERLHFQVEQDTQGFRLGAKLTEANATGEWFMQDPTTASSGEHVDEAALDQLPIRVIFEVGRLDMPLGEVRRLAPGYVLPLVKPSESAVDIVANGRKIGEGSLMKIGDSIGVRVERLMADD